MNAHTKQQQDKVFATDFIDSQKSDAPICTPLGTKFIYIYSNIVLFLILLSNQFFIIMVHESFTYTCKTVVTCPLFIFISAKARKFMLDWTNSVAAWVTL